MTTTRTTPTTTTTPVPLRIETNQAGAPRPVSGWVDAWVPEGYVRAQGWEIGQVFHGDFGYGALLCILGERRGHERHGIRRLSIISGQASAIGYGPRVATLLPIPDLRLGADAFAPHRNLRAEMAFPTLTIYMDGTVVPINVDAKLDLVSNTAGVQVFKWTAHDADLRFWAEVEVTLGYRSPFFRYVGRIVQSDFRTAAGTSKPKYTVDGIVLQFPDTRQNPDLEADFDDGLAQTWRAGQALEFRGRALALPADPALHEHWTWPEEDSETYARCMPDVWRGHLGLFGGLMPDPATRPVWQRGRLWPRLRNATADTGDTMAFGSAVQDPWFVEVGQLGLIQEAGAESALRQVFHIDPNTCKQFRHPRSNDARTTFNGRPDDRFADWESLMSESYRVANSTLDDRGRAKLAAQDKSPLTTLDEAHASVTYDLAEWMLTGSWLAQARIDAFAEAIVTSQHANWGVGKKGQQRAVGRTLDVLAAGIVATEEDSIARRYLDAGQVRITHALQRMVAECGEPLDGEIWPGGLDNAYAGGMSGVTNAWSPMQLAHQIAGMWRWSLVAPAHDHRDLCIRRAAEAVVSETLWPDYAIPGVVTSLDVAYVVGWLDGARMAVPAEGVNMKWASSTRTMALTFSPLLALVANHPRSTDDLRRKARAVLRYLGVRDIDAGRWLGQFVTDAARLPWEGEFVGGTVEL